jgi:hypothetical protein
VRLYAVHWPGGTVGAGLVIPHTTAAAITTGVLIPHTQPLLSGLQGWSHACTTYAEKLTTNYLS